LQNCRNHYDAARGEALDRSGPAVVGPSLRVECFMDNSIVWLAQSSFGSGGNSSQLGGGAVAAICFVELLIAIAVIGGLWKMFTKAGQPGWAAIVPIYNTIVMLQVVGRPIWWILLMLIPIVNLVVAIIICIDLAKSFGRGIGTAIGLILLPFVFIPILGFGPAEYAGPAAA
jgi:hypothetical protein